MAKSIQRKRRRNPNPWAKPVQLEHIKSVLASDLSGVEFAVYVYGLLRSGEKGTFYSVLADAAKCTGHDRKRISEANTSLCARKLFEHTGRFRQRKYPVFRVPMPKDGSKLPVPLRLREEIHALSGGALRLLVLLIVKGGWNPLGCVVPYESATALAAEAGISEATANTAFWELKESGWIVFELAHGKLAEVLALRGWRALITVTQKAGFVVPPMLPFEHRARLLYALGTANVYPAFDKRQAEGALQSSPKMRNGEATFTPKRRNGSTPKMGNG